METTSRGQAEKHPPPPTDGPWKEGGGGEQGGKVVMGGRALRKRAGGEDGLALGKQVTTVIGFFIFSVFSLFSCCFFILFYFLAVIMGDLLCLDRAQVNTYGSVMIQDGAAAHDSPHTTAKAATLMFASGHEC